MWEGLKTNFIKVLEALFKTRDNAEILPIQGGTVIPLLCRKLWGANRKAGEAVLNVDFCKKKKKRKDAFLVRFTVWLNNPFSPVLIPGKSIEAEDKTVYPL